MKGMVMRLIDELASLFSTSLQSQALEGDGPYRGGRITGFCQQLSWAVAERDGKNTEIRFRDALGKIRKVFIFGDDDPLVTIAVYSFAILPTSKVPEQVLGHLLRQNSELLQPAWQVGVNDNDEALFSLRYCALGEGLTPATFKYLVETMLTEAVTFDLKMHKAGLLR
jgi:hypothetical protein